MKTKIEQKIEILTEEIEEAKENLANIEAKIEKGCEELIKLEITMKDDENYLAELKAKMEVKKDRIPDFSEELCALYLDYNETKSEYERNIGWHNEVKERYEKRHRLFDAETESREGYEERIRFLNTELAKAKAEKERI